MDKNILESIKKLSNLNNNIKPESTIYQFNDIPVPRVTNILSDTIGKDYLAKWAANLGKKYFIESQNILNIGTLTHQWIEDFLLHKKKSENFVFSPDVESSSIIAYSNFLKWYDKFTKIYQFEVIAAEKELACPYYGGTTDCIAKINNHYTLIDFKTSKKIDYSYIMQLCAYMWIINNYHTELPHIDTIGIIRVGKVPDDYEDLFLSTSDLNQLYIINRAMEAFMIAVQHYYSIHNLYSITTQYSQNYDIKKVFVKEKENGTE